MSLHTVIARINELNAAFAPPVAPAPPAAPAAPASSSTGGSPTSNEFASMLQGAMGPAAATGPAAVGAPGGSVGQKIVALAQGEIGVKESPPGSNNSPRIAEYRAATAGAPGPGPWCAYFTSWAAREAGAPVGPSGSGFGSVDALYAWAQKAGKALPGSSTPQPGDLIVWDEHIGIVESVGGGKIRTIEGNSSDKVSRRTYGSNGGGAIGYVRMGG